MGLIKKKIKKQSVTPKQKQKLVRSKKQIASPKEKQLARPPLEKKQLVVKPSLKKRRQKNLKKRTIPDHKYRKRIIMQRLGFKRGYRGTMTPIAKDWDGKYDRKRVTETSLIRTLGEFNYLGRGCKWFYERDDGRYFMYFNSVQKRWYVTEPPPRFRHVEDVPEHLFNSTGSDLKSKLGS